MDNQPQQVETVFRSKIGKESRDATLTLEAAGIAYKPGQEAGEFTLVVTARDAPRARAELEALARENPATPTNSKAPPPQAGGWTGVLGYTTVLILVAALAHLNPFAADWFTAGRMNAGQVRDGQWWRIVTALTLHVDLQHLASNIVFGGIVGLFAGQLLGSGVAWAGILGAGAAGNLLNACLRTSNHNSVGASTAVFGALGMIAACAWLRRRRLQGPILARWAPLVGAVVLLGYLGAGGARTDVAAHVTGFLSGLAIGALFGKPSDRLILARRTQLALGLAALAAVALAWARALTPLLPGIP